MYAVFFVDDASLANTLFSSVVVTAEFGIQRQYMPLFKAHRLLRNSMEVRITTCLTSDDLPMLFKGSEYWIFRQNSKVERVPSGNNEVPSL
jgi:hypothetical protein